MSFDSTQLSSDSLSTRGAPLLQGVTPSIRNHELLPAGKIKQTIQNAASSIMNQLGEELQKAWAAHPSPANQAEELSIRP